MKPLASWLLVALAITVSGCREDSGGAPPSLVDPSHKVGSPVDAPFPDEWKSAAWYLDPGNVTGCASDVNTGTSATCTANTTIGPLKSWQGLDVVKWGCRGAPSGCPRLRQSTTITFLSAATDNTDPVVFNPQIEAMATVTMTGSLGAAQQQATGTLNVVTAKNRATPQQLASTFTLTAPDGGAAPTLLPDWLVLDTTHAAAAWLYTVSGGILTQPLARPASPVATATPAEVDTWANADAVAMYQPVTANLVKLAPVLADINSSTFFPQFQVVDLAVYEPNGSAANLDELTLGGNVPMVFDEVSFGRTVQLAPLDASLNTSFVNCDFLGTISGGNGSTNITVKWTGGDIRGAFSAVQAQVDGDTYVGNNALTAMSAVGTAYVASGKVWQMYSDGASIQSASAYNTAQPVIWGPGTLNIVGATRMGYASGSGKAALEFLVTTLQLNGQTKGCLDIQGAASTFGTCNITVTAANLDTNLGATSGCVTVGMGGAFCNYGP